MILPEPIREEPVHSHRNLSYDAVLEAVSRSPGEWFRIAEFATASNASNAALKLRDRHPEFSFAARTKDGKGMLYAYYKVNPPPQES